MMEIRSTHTLRLKRRWAESLLTWSDRSDNAGFICVEVGEDGTGQWYACDLKNILHLDGREKAGMASASRAGVPGTYYVQRAALAVAAATTDALARLQMHDSDDVRVEPLFLAEVSGMTQRFEQVKAFVSSAKTAAPATHGHGFPYHGFKWLMEHFDGCWSSVGVDIASVEFSGMSAWRIATYSRFFAIVMGAAMKPAIAERCETRPKPHPTATVEVLADTLQVRIPGTDSGHAIYPYYCGDLKPGEAVAVDVEGVPWIVPAE